MQAAETLQSSVPTQGQANHELNMQLLNANQAKLKQEEGHDWISNEFNRLPYQIYQYWIVLSFLITLAAEFYIINLMNTEGRAIGDYLVFAGLIPILYGSGEMLWAIMRRKSKLVQQALSKFNYGNIVSIIGSLFALSDQEGLTCFLFGSDGGLLRFLIYILIQASHYFGVIAVIRAFKKNHPLERQRGSEDMEADERDIVEQNKIIEGEALKYDQKLNSCPYLALRCWFKFIVIFETIRVIFDIFLISEIILNQEGKINRVKETPRAIALLLLSSLTLYSCFQMEAALRKKRLVESKKALIALKVVLMIAGIVFLMSVGGLTFSKESEDKVNYLVVYLFWFGMCLLIPIVTFIGAVNMDRILEERDKIAKFSNFNGDDSYL